MSVFSIKHHLVKCIVLKCMHYCVLASEARILIRYRIKIDTKKYNRMMVEIMFSYTYQFLKQFFVKF